MPLKVFFSGARLFQHFSLSSYRHTKYAAFEFLPTGQVYSEATCVIADARSSVLAQLCSSIYEIWAFEYGSSLGHTLRYTPSDCFETFPFPTNYNTLEAIGETYYTHRQSIMHTTQQGLTKTYNRFHNPEDTAEDIAQLRKLHIEMDTAVPPPTTGKTSNSITTSTKPSRVYASPSAKPPAAKCSIGC